MSAKPVEQESKLKKKSVQPAAESQPEPEVEQPEPQKLLSIKDIVASVDPKMMKTASNMGIPLEPLLKYMWQQEQLTMALVESKQKITQGLQPLMTAVENQPHGQIQPKPASNMASFMEILPSILGNAQASNPMMDRMMEKIMDRALATLDRGSRTDDAIYAAITSKLASKVAAEVVP